MYEPIREFLRDYMPLRLATPLTYILVVLVIAALCILANGVTKGVLVAASRRVVRRTKAKWDSIFYENRFFHRISGLSVPIVLTSFAEGLPQYGGLLSKAASIAGIVVFLRIFETVIGAVSDIYKLYEISRTRPIRGLLQVVQVSVYIVCAVVAVAMLAGKSPFVLLGGIGAATAVTSFIFKDAILGFVAGIQLTSNDMIHIGDWIEMPKYSADGTVIDLSMTTVKVQNFDQTITAIPAYTLVSDAFINWRGMECAGARRIKRSIFIAAADVRLCDDKMIAHFQSMALLRDYLDKKLAEIEQFNREHGTAPGDPIGGRRITNVGTFRAYILAYLERHPGIDHSKTTMVRQLAPDDRGLPLELYAFADTTVWQDYENTQSDIFDHLYSVVQEFGLRIYQKPSSADIRSLHARQ